jgi:hypothetical protein
MQSESEMSTILFNDNPPKSPSVPQEDINLALEIEKNVPPNERELYLECMGDKPMSAREGYQSVRDGCILTHHVYLKCSKLHPARHAK